MEVDIKDILVGPKISVRSAMKKLDATARRILFVLDDDLRLIGSLTDGDVRRWILSNGSLDEPVLNVCNKNPKSIQANERDLEQTRNTMIAQGVDCLPVLDERGAVIDLKMLRQVLKSEEEPRRTMNVPVAIMAGGKGTRMAPYTRILPKPLIPLGEKSVIEVIIDNFAKYGVRQYYISVNHKANMVRSFLDEVKLPFDLHFIHESEFYGTAGSLKLLEGKVTGPFFVSNCDIIVESDYVEILDFHTCNHNDITVVASMKHYPIPYGVCEIETGGKLLGINEKPEFDLLVNIGLYVLNAEMVELIPGGTTFHMTDLVQKAQSIGANVMVFPVSEKSWLDVGELEEFKKVTKQMGL